MQNLLRRTSGFTLLELMISMTIFSVMMVIVLSVYFNTTETARRLNMTRQLSETAREITERLAQDIRQYGFSGSATEFDLSPSLWSNTDEYMNSGSEILNLNNARYVYGKKKSSGMDTCAGANKTDTKIHCGLYKVEYGDNGTLGYNLVDSFVPEEEKKRVKVESLRFYISGDANNSRKVMLNMTLTLMPRIGVPRSLVTSTKLHVQTTISERIYKTY